MTRVLFVISAADADGTERLSRTYYSIGGGFVLTEREMKTASLKGDDAKIIRGAALPDRLQRMVRLRLDRRLLVAELLRLLEPFVRQS